MKFAIGEPIPLDEENPHLWWERNRGRLQQLRAIGRACGARTYGNEMPALNVERYRLELEERGYTPTAVDLLSLGGGTFALRSDTTASIASEGWLLFRHRPTGVVARALELLTPVKLALAIRAWDPEALQPASTEAELRGYRDRVRKMNARLKHLMAASEDEPAVAIDLATSMEIRSPQGLIEDAIRELTKRRDSFESWVNYRARLAMRTTDAEAAILPLTPRDRLPPMFERQISGARMRWWAPAASVLRASGWTDLELATLLLEEQWFLDLVPFTRLHYENDPRHPALLDQLRNVRRTERRRVSRSQAKQRPKSST